MQEGGGGALCGVCRWHAGQVRAVFLCFVLCEEEGGQGVMGAAVCAGQREQVGLRWAEDLRAPCRSWAAHADARGDDGLCVFS